MGFRLYMELTAAGLRRTRTGFPLGTLRQGDQTGGKNTLFSESMKKCLNGKIVQLRFLNLFLEETDFICTTLTAEIIVGLF
jgi:hypothetical protein